jgi:hypothetical protein
VILVSQMKSVLLVFVATLWIARTDRLEAQGCNARAAGSRWVAAAASAVQTQVYGSGDTWIATLAGVATVPGRVFVFDEGKPSVSELTPTLVPVREFGRAGNGPGEISGGLNLRLVDPSANYNFVGVNRTKTVIYDRRDIEVYGSIGTPEYSIRFPMTGPVMYGVRQVQPLGDSALLAIVDSVDITGQRPRRLQGWVIRGNAASQMRTLLWELPVPGDSGAALTSINNRISRPYWARIDGCQVATDGANRFLFRYDERTGHTDSLLLPDWQVPAWGKARGDRSSIGIAGRRVVEPHRPASLACWWALVVDPDGWAWIRAWTEELSELRVFAISLASGQVVEVRTPAFPRAFGEPGVFYATTRNRATEEVLVLRFQGRVQ